MGSATIGVGHEHDCFVIDDARLFTSAPPRPLDPTHWPALIDIFDAIRSRHPQHVVTLLSDQIIAVPPPARSCSTTMALAYAETRKAAESSTA